MIPQYGTKFLPFSELEQYSSLEKFSCTKIEFSPETRDGHFASCPPYIEIIDNDSLETIGYFEIPATIAYYAKNHAGYTQEGRKNNVEEGKREMSSSIRKLLNM